MANTDKASKVAEKPAEKTQDSYRPVVDHVVGPQERNVRSAWGMVEG